MKNILILGATGRLSSIIVDSLYKTPEITLRLSSSREDAVSMLQSKYPLAECVQADFYDVDSLTSAFSGVEQVLIIPPDFVIDEYQVVPNIVEAFRRSDSVKQIVRSIATPVGLTPSDLPEEYLASRAGVALHTLGKHLLDQTDLPLTYVNLLAWFTSNIPWFFADDVKRLNKLRLPGVDIARPWLADEDMAQCFVNILSEQPEQHLNKEYMIISEDRYTFTDIAALLSHELGRDIRFVNTDAGLKDAGQHDLANYINIESQFMKNIDFGPRNDTEQLLKRAPMSLASWIKQNRALFV